MSQPLKNTANTVVLIGFHVFVVLVILMISGTCLDLIFETFGGLGTPFKWFSGVLDMHWNLIDFQDHPELRAWTWWVVNCQSRAYCYKSYIISLLTSRPSNTSLLTCWPSNSNCRWNVGRILGIWHQWMKEITLTSDLKPLPSQPDGPCQAGAGGFSRPNYVVK